MIRYSSETDKSSSSTVGTTPVFSYSTPLCTSRVASPPSSRIMFGPTRSPSASVNLNSCSVHHQYSSSVSPFQAKTGTPCGSSAVPCGPTTTAAAAWSWVEKMLQHTQRTSAPRLTRVSISTAVWTVMCSEPAILAVQRPRLGVLAAQGHQPGHLVLGQPDLLAAELGERQVGDGEVDAAQLWKRRPGVRWGTRQGGCQGSRSCGSGLSAGPARARTDVPGTAPGGPARPGRDAGARCRAATARCEKRCDGAASRMSEAPFVR